MMPKRFTIYALLAAACAMAAAWLLLFPAAENADEKKPELTIATYDSFASGPGPQIKAVFEETCDCTVKYLAADTSLGMLGRIRLEGGDSKADIALGLDTAFTDDETRKYFAPHGIEPAGLALPSTISGGGWTDAEFIPFDWGYFAFVYDETRLASPPNSFRELIESDVKIVIQDPRTATPGMGLLLWVKSAYGGEAKTIWQGLAPRIVTVTKGWWDAYSLFLEGEADMVLSYSTSPAYHIAEGKTQYAAASFAEGHYTQVEVAGILKSSRNKELAREFLRALTSPEMQSIIPTTNWMYPVARDAALPDGFKGLIAPEKALLFDAGEIDRKEWVDEWVQGLSQ